MMRSWPDEHRTHSQQVVEEVNAHLNAMEGSGGEESPEMGTSLPSDVPSLLGALICVVERIDARLAQIETFFGASAAFMTEMTAPPAKPRDFADYKETATIGHYLVLVDGLWVEATPEEDALVAHHVSQRRKKR